MSPLFYLFAAALLAAQFLLPRRLAFAPLVVAVCHFQNVPLIEVGGAFSIFKLVVLAGLLRAWRERVPGPAGRQSLDVLVAIWALWMLVSGFAHHPKDHNPITIRLSVILDFGGAYLYARCFIKNHEDLLQFFKTLAVVLLPLAMMVAIEKLTQRNFYSILSGGLGIAETRKGRIRVAGPFGHAILLGTFGAVCLPLVMAVRRYWPRLAMAGMAGCVLIVAGSGSSGPILTLMAAIGALVLWRWRGMVGLIRKLAILAILGLHLVMNAPVWYLLARIDLAGGSTGWHRAELITAALKHLGEWWLVGTDYTRHWIAYGVLWSEYHIDITNYYIRMGVVGGLPLMLLFIFILIRGFGVLGRAMTPLRLRNDPAEFTLWCCGAALFAHCITFFSISYFDQSNVFLGMFLGGFSGVCITSSWASEPEGTTEPAETGAISGHSQPAQPPVGGSAAAAHS